MHGTVGCTPRKVNYQIELNNLQALLAPLQGLQLFGEEQMTSSDYMAVEQAEQDAQQDRMVVLADVWLDKPDTLDRLHTVFAGVQGMP